MTGRPGQAPHSSQTGSKTSAHLMEINKEVITWRLSHGALPLPTQPLEGACQFPFKFNFSPVIKVLATKSLSTNERNGSSFLVRFERRTTYYSWLGLVNSHGHSANSIWVYHSVAYLCGRPALRFSVQSIESLNQCRMLHSKRSVFYGLT